MAVLHSAMVEIAPGYAATATPWHASCMKGAVPERGEWVMDGQRATGSDDLGMFLDAGLRIAGLPLEEELRPRVLMHLETAVAMAKLVAGFPLPDEAEPAPVYVP